MWSQRELNEAGRGPSSGTLAGEVPCARLELRLPASSNRRGFCCSVTKFMVVFTACLGNGHSLGPPSSLSSLTLNQPVPPASECSMGFDSQGSLSYTGSLCISP